MQNAISVGRKTVRAQTPNCASPGSPHEVIDVDFSGNNVAWLLIKLFRDTCTLYNATHEQKQKLKSRKQLYDSAEIKTRR